MKSICSLLTLGTLALGLYTFALVNSTLSGPIVMAEDYQILVEKSISDADTCDISACQFALKSE